MADFASADRLQKLLEGAREWPLKGEVSLLRDLYLWRAFYEVDGDRIKPEDWPDGKRYLCDPLAQRIADAKADLMFGEEPDFTHPDQGQLDDIVESNQLGSTLPMGASMQVSEGEAWWRIVVNKAASDFPILEFHSRTVVYPLYRNRVLMACAFINVIEETDGSTKKAWRYVEIHAKGLVRNLLYEVQNAHTDTSRTVTRIPQSAQPGKQFGLRVDLRDRPETEDLPEQWVHGLDIMLAGRVRNNRRGRNFRIGVSDFKAVKDLLYVLNEALNVGRHNLRLTAKQRAIISAAVLQSQTVQGANGQQLTLAPPTFDPEEDFFVAEAFNESLDSDNSGPFKILEYSFEAQSLILYDSHTEDKVLTRSRTAPQLVGKNTEGAQTGPALRARLLDSILDADAKGGYWDDEAPKFLNALVLVDALPTGTGDSQGGFGRSYSTSKAEAPKMERTSPLPEDEDAQVLRLSTEVGAGLLSRKSAIAERHPDWDEARVDEELRAIVADEAGEAPEPPEGGEGGTT